MSEQQQLQQQRRKKKNKDEQWETELRGLMYGFGDASLNPVEESVHLLHDMVIEYIEHLTLSTLQIHQNMLDSRSSSSSSAAASISTSATANGAAATANSNSNTNKHQAQARKPLSKSASTAAALEALLFVIHDDEAKLVRAKELLKLNAEIAKARAQHLKESSSSTVNEEGLD